MQKLNSPIKKTDHIGINRILFDESARVTLQGFSIAAGRQKPMNYFINFDPFNKLLRLSGKDGDDIQMLVVEKLEKGIGNPSTIDLKMQLGYPVLLNHCILEISAIWTKDLSGAWIEDKKYMSIDAVYPLAKKRRQTIALQTRYRQTLVECEEMLAGCYDLYLGYLELEIDEDTALRMAELEDDLKFKIAYNAWKMNQTSM